MLHPLNFLLYLKEEVSFKYLIDSGKRVLDEEKANFVLTLFLADLSGQSALRFAQSVALPFIVWVVSP